MSIASQKRSFQSSLYHIERFIWQGVDWLFPPVCAGCGDAHYRFCPKCVQQVIKTNLRHCPFCGDVLPRAFKPHSCSHQTHIDRALVWGLHSGPLRVALHQFKYRRDLGLADTFARYLISIFSTVQVHIDLVIPVPLAKKRYQERGYNQAALLAAAFSGQLGMRCRPAAAKRIIETKSQVGLNIEQRRENVAGAFWADNRKVFGKSVLLIDDVLTTGATLNACAQALKQAGAQQVIALAVARAP